MLQVLEDADQSLAQIPPAHVTRGAAQARITLNFLYTRHLTDFNYRLRKTKN